MKHRMNPPHSFQVQHVQSDPMSDAVVVTPTFEMVARSSKTTGGSPVSVASHPSSVGADCAPALSPTQRDSVLRTACQKAYGKHVITTKGRTDGLGTEELSSLAVVMHPIVVVGEDGGAEVSLDQSSSHFRRQPESLLVTPVKKPPYGRDLAALLDVDLSPSPMPTKSRSLDSIRESRTPASHTSSPRRPAPIDVPSIVPHSPQRPSKSPKSPFGPKLCCGTGCWPGGDDGDTALVSTTQASLEDTICGLLGSAAGMDDFCDGWQAFSYFTLGQNQQGSLQLKQDIRQALRNRACNMNARSRRIKDLQKNLRPFDENKGENGMQETVALTKTQSFCTSDHGASKARQTRRYSKAHSDVSGSAVSMSSAMWAVVSCNSGSKPDFPVKLEDDDRCYDSDPEEMTHRRVHDGVTRKKKAVSTFLRSGAWEDQFVNEEESPTNHDIERFNSLQPRRLMFDTSDDDSVKHAVKAFMNKRMTLIWHRGGDSADEVHGPPLAVKAWIEHGHRLRSTLIQPKLMWKPVNEPDDQKSSLGISSQNLHSIDLLDILRILEVNRIEQRRYALAKRSNSLLVESLDDTVLFEASSEEERNRIVDGLKMVVARLGSKVVVGDEDMFEEFFGFVPVGGLQDNEPDIW